MHNLLSDVKASAKVFGELRKARKEGADGIRISVQPVKAYPIIICGVSFYDTIEGCTLSHCAGEIEKAAIEAFHDLAAEEQHRLSRDIADGEFVERANYWRELLKPVLSPKQLNRAMRQIVHWYIHIKRDLRTGRSQNIALPEMGGAV